MELLEAGATPQGWKALEEKTRNNLILKGVNSADFMRFRGISEGCSNPLEEAGVDTVEELRHRVSGHLHQKMIEVNKKKLVREFPPYLKLRMGCDKRGNCFAT